MQKTLAFVLSLFVLAIIAPQVMAVSILSNPDKLIYRKNELLGGTLAISFNEYPVGMILNVSFEGNSKIFNVTDLISNAGNYTFVPQTFDYNISVTGRNDYINYPNVDFRFVLRVDTTTGANRTPWYSETANIPAVVNGNEKLKFIYNISSAIGLPSDSNPNDTVWSISFLSDNRVEGTMRQACGNQLYNGYYTTSNGWINIRLSGMTPTLSGNKAIFNIGIKFDDRSLSQDRRKFGGNGGVFKNGIYLNNPSEVEWNGTEGKIIINGYDYKSQYEVNLLPPPGPLFCAFTTYSESQSFDWEKKVTINGETNYFSNYSWTLPMEFIQNQAPDCPPGVSNCTKNIYNWSVYLVANPNNVSFNFDNASMLVSATTDKTTLNETYTENINVSDLLLSVDKPGNYTINFSLYKGDSFIVKTTRSFSVCYDADNDGICAEYGDCDDNDPNIYPDAPEKCNGKDDNCDGRIDETFNEAGKVLGTKCGIGACAGKWSCKLDGSGVFCNSTTTGTNPEICSNNIDDDCDGEIDEQYEMINGSLVDACVCKSGTTRPCGTDIGECKKGYQVCVVGNWSNCINNVMPKAEVCNGKDDDCDGIIDNIANASSIISSKCGCYGGGRPKEEECNGIDDDCDEEIDEDVSCCLEGDKRPCGSDIGECRKGFSTCIGGVWSACIGAVEPIPEVCYDRLDNDCDGDIDEGCIVQNTCRNGIKDLNEEGTDCGGVCPTQCADPFPMMIVGIFVIILIVIFAIVQVKGIFGREE